MLSELQQLLLCRREREDRAAASLRRVRAHHAHLQAKAAEAATHFRSHEHERIECQRRLYRRSLRSRMTTHEIDRLNVALDLMAEETETLARKVQDAQADVEKASAAIQEAASIYRRHRKAGDRWQHLVDDVAKQHRRRTEQAEEFAIEDDIGDRQSVRSDDLR